MYLQSQYVKAKQLTIHSVQEEGVLVFQPSEGETSVHPTSEPTITPMSHHGAVLEWGRSASDKF